MRILKKQITDVQVQKVWCSEWSRDKYAVWVTYTLKLFGIKLSEDVQLAKIFYTKQEARKYAKCIRHKYNLSRKYK